MTAEMNTVTWILLFVVIVSAWRLLKHPAPKDDKQPSKAATAPFHSVSIVAGAGACQTAKTLKGVRFLSDEAPLLPLISCDATRCNCKFAHHQDRRRGARRNPYSAQSHEYSHHGGEDRRHRRGRRQSDGMQVAPGL